MSSIASYIQKMYVNRISSSLPLFGWKSQKTANFRCVICGDSKKSKVKKRGTLYERDGDWFYKCHNCGQSLRFTTFLKEYFNDTYKEMLLENMRGSVVQDDISYVVEKKQMETKDWEAIMTPLTEFGPQHEAVQYVTKRKIPSHQFSRMCYTEDFNETYLKLCRIFEMHPDTSKHIPNKKAILFPFLDKEKNLLFVQGRFLDESEMRYMTVRFMDVSKIFGLEVVDTNKPVYVFEGAIDSFFISNSVATADADLTRASEYIDKSKLVLVYDNEPRSRIACSKIEKALKNGFKVVIFPERICEKDINLMHLAGIDVQELCEQNVYQGMLGLMKFQKWKRV